MKKVSIIVPVYNMEKYLYECLDSLVTQTYQNIEIILVDDGSTDSSYSICQEYSDRYSNVRCFHKENGGGGAARNLALEKVEGDYILFVDSDDWIVKNACELMVSLAEQYNADVVHCEVFKNREKILNNDNASVVSLGKKEIMETILNDKVRSGALKLFSKEAVADTRFPLNSSIDDMVFLSDIIERIQIMVVSDLELYYYRYDREDSMSNSQSRFVKNVYERYCEFIKRYSIALRNNVNGEEVYKKAIEHALVFYAHDEDADAWSQERRDVEAYIKHHLKVILTCGTIKMRDKLKCILLSMNPSIFMSVSKMMR